MSKRSQGKSRLPTERASAPRGKKGAAGMQGLAGFGVTMGACKRCSCDELCCLSLSPCR